jgi:hypothetical protein
MGLGSVAGIVQPAHAGVTIVGASYFDYRSDSGNSDNKAIVMHLETDPPAVVDSIGLWMTKDSGTILASISLPVSAEAQAAKAFSAPVFNQSFGMTFGARKVPVIYLTATTTGAFSFTCTIAVTIK